MKAEQKQVRIIGFELKQQLGILKAHKLEFDKDNHLIVFKGGVGQGKTTSQKAIQLTTQGSKTLVDKDLYGTIDTEVQLLDGEKSLWIGCKSDKNKKLEYVLYTKDDNGKKVKEPIIDGIKATPAKYLELLQTELTWKINELTSENPTVQKKILLNLYQHELTKLGVIMDKKHPDYKKSILGQIEEAEDERNQKDSIRKQKGGIADDLKAEGFDPDRPATIPDAINIGLINEKIKEQERQKTVKETQAETGQAAKLQEIKTKGAELINECVGWNRDLREKYEVDRMLYEGQEDSNNAIKESVKNIKGELECLVLNGGIHASIVDEITTILNAKTILKEKLKEPTPPLYIIFTDDNKIITKEIDKYDGKAKDLLQRNIDLREQYLYCLNETPETVDLSKFNKEIERLNEEKKKAIEINRIVEAVNSFHEWREANENVKELKVKYAKLLGKVNTGVDGLKIVPVESDGNLDIFLMYNGIHNKNYFNNPDKEFRKLSSYSGTQKPVICLLIQNYLLNQKPKALRYLFIDNIPMDSATVELLRKTCEDLDLTVLLNITGDFTQDNIQDGEILIDGGEVFFK